MTKYIQYFKESLSMKEFIAKAKKDYPNIKESTLQRRWYECNKRFDYDKINLMLRCKLEDIFRMKIKITPKLLRDEGFKYEEILYIMEKQNDKKIK